MMISTKLRSMVRLLFLFFSFSIITTCVKADNDDNGCKDGTCPPPPSSSSSPKDNNNDDDNDDSSSSSCGLWLGPSPIKHAENHGFGLGIFTGKKIKKGQTVESLYHTSNDGTPGGEMLLPIYGSSTINDEDYPPTIREYVWGEDNMPEIAIEYPHELTALFIPGLASIAPCTSKNYNLKWIGTGSYDETIYNSDDDPLTEIIRSSSSSSSSTSKNNNNNNKIFKRSHRESVISNTEGVHRSNSTTAGSFAYRHNISYIAIRDIVPGEELTVECSDDNFDGGAYYLSTFNSKDDAVICLDNNVHVKQQQSSKQSKSKSTSSNNNNEQDDDEQELQIGRGVYAKRTLNKDITILSSPVIPLMRNEMEINDEEVNTKQLMLNYCYGHKDSDLLLLPYGPIINYINNGYDNANAYIRWYHDNPIHSYQQEEDDDNEELDEETIDNDNNNIKVIKRLKKTNDELNRREQFHHKELLELSSDIVSKVHGKGLVIEIVAKRKINKDEEITINYGPDWLNAWKLHELMWIENKQPNYISAEQFNEKNKKEIIIRTEEEQKTNRNPYPSNLETFCFYEDPEITFLRKNSNNNNVNTNNLYEDNKFNDNNNDDNNINSRHKLMNNLNNNMEITNNLLTQQYYSWNDDEMEDQSCFRPCKILERYPNRNYNYSPNNNNNNNENENNDENDDQYRYTIFMSMFDDNRVIENCIIELDRVIMNVPKKAIRIVDRPYTTDVFMKSAFRHEIGIPNNNDFFPKSWMRQKLRKRNTQHLLSTYFDTTTTTTNENNENNSNNENHLEFQRKTNTSLPEKNS